MKKDKIQIQHQVFANAKCWNILKWQAAEFCRNTGLHGYKYISQTQRSKTERYVKYIIYINFLICFEYE